MGIGYKKIVRISWCSEFLSLAIPFLICNIILLNYGFVDAFIFNIIPVISCFVLVILSKMALIPNPKKTSIDETIRNSQPTNFASEQDANEASTPVQAERDKINISDDANNNSMQGTAALGDDQIISENLKDESSSNSSIKKDE